MCIWYGLCWLRNCRFLVKQGCRVIGVDVVQNKVDELNDGNWPIYEPGLNDKALLRKNFSATTDELKALENSDAVLSNMCRYTQHAKWEY